MGKQKVIQKIKYEDYDDYHKNQIAKREKDELEKALKESNKLAMAQTEEKTGFYSIFGNVKMDPRVKDEPIPPDESGLCALNRKSEMSDIIKQEEEDLKKALAESLKDLPGPSSAVNSWEIPPDIQPEIVPKVKPEIIEIKDEGSKCFSIFGSSRAVEKSGSTKRRGTSTRGSKTRGIKSRGRGKINSRGPLRGQTTLKRFRVDDAEMERQAKLKRLKEKEKEDFETAIRESLSDFQSERSSSVNDRNRYDEVDRRQFERTERLLAGIDPDEDEEMKMLDEILKG